MLPAVQPKIMPHALPFSLLFLFILLGLSPAAVPENCTQAIIGITQGWDDSRVVLSLVEKTSAGQWVRVLGPIPGRLGKNGSIWGLGLHSNPFLASTKKEGDGRSPAGIYALGGLWVTHKTPVQHHPGIPYVTVGAADLWVTDPRMPEHYNRHVRLDHPASTPWEKHEQMRQNDYAHSIKLLIRHNTEETPGRPIIGAGTAIFFHIWRRNGEAPTAGCTAMAEPHLRAIIARLRADRHPVYILLPRKEYTRYRKRWNLP